MACYGCGNPRHGHTNAMNATNALTTIGVNSTIPMHAATAPFPAGPTTPNLPNPYQRLQQQSQQEIFSPRFAAGPVHRGYPAHAFSQVSMGRPPSPPLNVPQPPMVPSKAPAPSYPLLTPSGHALASGGRVRNISGDAMAPCVMYWPDNEPLPERGQIRPLASSVIQYPPIINTGNKGAAEKQPGDWTCSKCQYLNWRRRKVCQTCYPYAEGNGDSISQAVQAERIALLTNVLNQVNDSAVPLPVQLHRRASVPAQPPHSSSTYIQQPPQFSHPLSGHVAMQQGGRVAHPSPLDIVGPRISAVTSSRSRSHMDLRSSYRHPATAYEEFGLSRHGQQPSPTLYQTHRSSHPTSPDGTNSTRSSRVPSPREYGAGTLGAMHLQAEANAATLLPSFLQDMVQTRSMEMIQASPATSNSSWSLEEYEYEYAPQSAYEYDGEGIGLHAGGPRSEASSMHPGLEGRQSGVGVIGRPRVQGLYDSSSRSSSSTSSLTGTTNGNGIATGMSIWEIDGEESQTWKPSSAAHLNGSRLYRSHDSHRQPSAVNIVSGTAGRGGESNQAATKTFAPASGYAAVADLADRLAKSVTIPSMVSAA
ncbi:hypothetical protein BDW22DRAFT_1346529 [Trametopsis cervina]|nr:hypothetical protein BDW22DRAFT_1346529 [Trametopsis cervina]